MFLIANRIQPLHRLRFFQLICVSYLSLCLCYRFAACVQWIHGFPVFNKIRCRKVPQSQNKLKIKWLVRPNLLATILLVIDGIFVCE